MDSTFYTYNPPADYADSERRELCKYFNYYDLLILSSMGNIGKKSYYCPKNFCLFWSIFLTLFSNDVGNGQLNFNGQTIPLPVNQSATNEYHTFAFEWLPGSVKWYVRCWNLLKD